VFSAADKPADNPIKVATLVTKGGDHPWRICSSGVPTAFDSFR
jgi:hypothetical protein